MFIPVSRKDVIISTLLVFGPISQKRMKIEIYQQKIKSILNVMSGR
jgi:hypothetical protein